MITAALIFAGLAALLHVYIFVMESLTVDFTAHPRRLRHHRRGSADHQAAGLQPGLLQPVPGDRHRGRHRAAVIRRHDAVGVALIFAGVGSMLAAAVVLLASSPDKARAAVTQGAFPLIAVVLLAVALATQ